MGFQFGGFPLPVVDKLCHTSKEGRKAEMKKKKVEGNELKGGEAVPPDKNVKNDLFYKYTIQL